MFRSFFKDKIVTLVVLGPCGSLLRSIVYSYEYDSRTLAGKIFLHAAVSKAHVTALLTAAF